MNSKVLQERIDSLTINIEKFRLFVGKYYSRESPFPHSSYFFHRKVIDKIRVNNYQRLFENDLFLEYVYATLSSWGLDRMDGSARLVEFESFKASVLSNLNLLKELFNIKLNTLLDADEKEVIDKLALIFDNLKVMESRSKLVGTSKTLHHLLPDLVPPVDRRFTLNFFYQTKYLKSPPIKGDEKERFLEIFHCYYVICKRLSLSEQNLEREWDTSIPKLIDNAIIGFVIKNMIQI